MDSDCNGTESCYIDADGDGYRTTDGAVTPSDSLSCNGAGVANADAPATDCDDTRGDVNPGARDAVGDEVDGDCDGFEDCFVDADGDGFRTLDVVESIDADCTDEGEASLEVPLVDCDDTRAGVNPDATEIPGDGVDQDCDGVDPASASDTGPGDEMGDPVDEEDEAAADAAEDDKEGCGCSSTARPAHLAWAVPLMGLIGLRRRRA